MQIVAMQSNLENMLFIPEPCKKKKIERHDITQKISAILYKTGIFGFIYDE